MWFWNSTPRHLPLTQGPYVPGCVDVMSGFTEEATFARLYYPTALDRNQNTPSRWFKWIPHEKYLEGFAKLVNGYATLIRMLVWTYGGEPLVPCVWEGAPIINKKLPVIAFSHGFGGTRFVSATIGAELASYGFLVASMEHRETSASATYYYANVEDRDADRKTWIPHERIKFGPNHYPIRNKQLHKRMEEMKKLIDYMEDINNGKAQNILKSNFDVQLFKDRLDLSKLSLMGHSFGGAASLLTMANDKRPKCAVILDGWMFPLKEEEICIEKPLLFLNTQSFHIESNLSAMNKIIDYNHQENPEKQAFTIRYTTHESHTDTPHVMGYWLDWFQKKLNPVKGTNISNFLTLAFYNRVLGCPEEMEEEEKYLEENDDSILKGTQLFVKGQRITVAKY